MLAFIDESGLPNPGDASTRPVVTAVCYDENKSRTITRQLHALKRMFLDQQQTDAELKGKKRLKEKTYLHSNASRLFAEDFFAALRGWQITVFAIIMRAPFMAVALPQGRLDNRYRFLLQRIDLLAGERASHANVMFDGRGDAFKDLSRRFSGYLFRSQEGQKLANLTDTPAFADSATSAGIQIADMCAYVIREYQENQLFAKPPSQDSGYQRAVRSWYRYVESLSRDFDAPNGVRWHGFYFLQTGLR